VLLLWELCQPSLGPPTSSAIVTWKLVRDIPMHEPDVTTRNVHNTVIGLEIREVYQPFLRVFNCWSRDWSIISEYLWSPTCSHRNVYR
jgi:hypothetical protein